MVSDAMTAPGPKMVSHASGLRDSNPDGSGSELSSGLAFEAALISLAGGAEETPSPPSEGGEEARLHLESPLLDPLPTRPSWGKEEAARVKKVAQKATVPAGRIAPAHLRTLII